MSNHEPPPDTPNFESLGHERMRAFKVWFFLRSNHGNWFTVSEISNGIGLAESTVRNALSRIFGLPPLMRPRLERQIVESDEGRLIQYRFRGIVNILFE